MKNFRQKYKEDLLGNNILIDLKMKNNNKLDRSQSQTNKSIMKRILDKMQRSGDPERSQGKRSGNQSASLAKAAEGGPAANEETWQQQRSSQKIEKKRVRIREMKTDQTWEAPSGSSPSEDGPGQQHEARDLRMIKGTKKKGEEELLRERIMQLEQKLQQSIVPQKNAERQSQAWRHDQLRNVGDHQISSPVMRNSMDVPEHRGNDKQTSLASQTPSNRKPNSSAKHFAMSPPPTQMPSFQTLNFGIKSQGKTPKNNRYETHRLDLTHLSVNSDNTDPTGNQDGRNTFELLQSPETFAHSHNHRYAGAAPLRSSLPPISSETPQLDYLARIGKDIDRIVKDLNNNLKALNQKRDLIKQQTISRKSDSQSLDSEAVLAAGFRSSPNLTPASRELQIDQNQIRSNTNIKVVDQNDVSYTSSQNGQDKLYNRGQRQIQTDDIYTISNHSQLSSNSQKNKFLEIKVKMAQNSEQIDGRGYARELSPILMKTTELSSMNRDRYELSHEFQNQKQLVKNNPRFSQVVNTNRAQAIKKAPQTSREFGQVFKYPKENLQDNSDVISQNVKLPKINQSVQLESVSQRLQKKQTDLLVHRSQRLSIKIKQRNVVNSSVDVYTPKAPSGRRGHAPSEASGVDDLRTLLEKRLCEMQTSVRNLSTSQQDQNINKTSIASRTKKQHKYQSIHETSNNTISQSKQQSTVHEGGQKSLPNQSSQNQKQSASTRAKLKMVQYGNSVSHDGRGISSKQSEPSKAKTIDEPYNQIEFGNLSQDYAQVNQSEKNHLQVPNQLGMPTSIGHSASIQDSQDQSEVRNTHWDPHRCQMTGDIPMANKRHDNNTKQMPLVSTSSNKSRAVRPRVQEARRSGHGEAAPARNQSKEAVTKNRLNAKDSVPHSAKTKMVIVDSSMLSDGGETRNHQIDQATQENTHHELPEPTHKDANYLSAIDGKTKNSHDQSSHDTKMLKGVKKKQKLVYVIDDDVDQHVGQHLVQSIDGNEFEYDDDDYEVIDEIDDDGEIVQRQGRLQSQQVQANLPQPGHTESRSQMENFIAEKGLQEKKQIEQQSKTKDQIQIQKPDQHKQNPSTKAQTRPQQKVNQAEPQHRNPKRQVRTDTDSRQSSTKNATPRNGSNRNALVENAERRDDSRSSRSKPSLAKKVGQQPLRKDVQLSNQSTKRNRQRKPNGTKQSEKLDEGNTNKAQQEKNQPRQQQEERQNQGEQSNQQRTKAQKQIRGLKHEEVDKDEAHEQRRQPKAFEQNTKSRSQIPNKISNKQIGSTKSNTSSTNAPIESNKRKEKESKGQRVRGKAGRQGLPQLEFSASENSGIQEDQELDSDDAQQAEANQKPRRSRKKKSSFIENEEGDSLADETFPKLELDDTFQDDESNESAEDDAMEEDEYPDQRSIIRNQRNRGTYDIEGSLSYEDRTRDLSHDDVLLKKRNRQRSKAHPKQRQGRQEVLQSSDGVLPKITTPAAAGHMQSNHKHTTDSDQTGEESPATHHFEGHQPQKLSHYKIRQTNIHPYSALDFAINEAKQQLEIYPVLTKILNSDKISHGQHSDQNNESDADEINYGSPRQKYSNFKYTQIINRFHLNIEPQLMSRIHDGVEPIEHLNEGLWIMKDTMNYLNQVKSGKFNHMLNDKQLQISTEIGFDQKSRFPSGTPGQLSNGRRSQVQRSQMRNRGIETPQSNSGYDVLRTLKKRRNFKSVVNSSRNGSRLPSISRRANNLPDQESQAGDEQDEQNIELMRAMQIKRLENEYMKLGARFVEVTDPRYLSTLQTKLLNAEQDRVDKLAQIKKLEASQKNLDIQIAKHDKQKEKLIGRMHAGKVVDSIKFEGQNLLADMEVITMKLELQSQDLKQLNNDNSDLKTLIKEEQENFDALKDIAKDKYQLDLKKIDGYLAITKEKSPNKVNPRSRKCSEVNKVLRDHELGKVNTKQLEQKMVKQAHQEKIQIKNQAKEQQCQNQKNLGLVTQKLNRLETLKIRLKKRAQVSQKIVEQAMAAGVSSTQLLALQEMKEKVHKALLKSKTNGNSGQEKDHQAESPPRFQPEQLTQDTQSTLLTDRQQPTSQRHQTLASLEKQDKTPTSSRQTSQNRTRSDERNSKGKSSPISVSLHAKSPNAEEIAISLDNEAIKERWAAQEAGFVGGAGGMAAAPFDLQVINENEGQEALGTIDFKAKGIDSKFK